MNILLLDSSFDLLQLAIYKISGSKSQIYYSANNDKIFKGEHAIYDLDHLLQQASITLNDLDVVVFNRGPGSFVGTRIATSIVQALVTANENLKVAGASSLLTMVAQWLEFKTILLDTVDNKDSSFIQYLAELESESSLSYFVALDANMRESYANLYQVQDGKIQPRGEERLLTINQMQDLAKYSTLLTREDRVAFISSHPDLESFNLDPQDRLILLGNAWSKYTPDNTNNLQSLLEDAMAISNNLTFGKCEQYLSSISYLKEKPSLVNIASLPDYRLLTSFILDILDTGKYINHFAIEPTYVRNNVAY